MPNRPGNDDRSSTVGSVGQRDVSHESGRNPAGGTAARTRSNRGFASMDREKQKEIASKGGKAAHAKGTAHEFDSSEARAAGRKGGMAVSRNREHMAAIGRRGGEARGQRARQAAQAGVGSRASVDAARQNTPGITDLADTRGSGSEREIGISGTSIGATQNTRGGENAL